MEVKHKDADQSFCETQRNCVLEADYGIVVYVILAMLMRHLALRSLVLCSRRVIWSPATKLMTRRRSVVSSGTLRGISTVRAKPCTIRHLAFREQYLGCMEPERLPV